VLIRFDAFVAAMQYLSAAINGRPYMGVGRNLSYRKNVFFRSKGFAKHNHILSGDDDLFVNENATSTNTALEIDPGSFTYTEAKKTFSQWLRQKSRHLSTAAYYKSSHKFSLSVKNGSVILFYLLLITLFVLRFDWRILVSLYALMLLARFPVIYIVSGKLREKDLAWRFPILEIMHCILQPIFYTTNLLTRKKSWK
jgi:biofilm PGA synthesis N-glycosyltransferase PgaC